MNPNEVAPVEFIKSHLRSGKKRQEILSLFVKKWQNSNSRTFDRRLSVAKKQMQVELKTIETKTNESIIKEIESRKSKIMTSLDRQELLSQIAKDTNPKVMASDKIRAIAELNKMGGDYAAQKVQSEGEMIIKVIRE